MNNLKILLKNKQIMTIKKYINLIKLLINFKKK